MIPHISDSTDANCLHADASRSCPLRQTKREVKKVFRPLGNLRCSHAGVLRKTWYVSTVWVAAILVPLVVTGADQPPGRSNDTGSGKGNVPSARPQAGADELGGPLKNRSGKSPGADNQSPRMGNRTTGNPPSATAATPGSEGKTRMRDRRETMHPWDAARPDASMKRRYGWGEGISSESSPRIVVGTGRVVLDSSSRDELCGRRCGVPPAVCSGGSPYGSRLTECTFSLEPCSGTCILAPSHRGRHFCSHGHWIPEPQNAAAAVAAVGVVVGTAGAAATDVVPAAPKCDFTQRRLLRTVVGPWRRVSTTVRSATVNTAKGQVTVAYADVVWARDIYNVLAAFECSLAKGHPGRHHGAERTEWKLEATVRETQTYGVGQRQTPPSPHYTDQLPQESPPQ